MKKTNKLKSVIASVLVTAALAAPVVVLSSVSDPFDAELIFEVEQSSGLVFHSDGSVQLLVNVAVDNAVNCRGASFHLEYNRDYLTPSYIKDTTNDTGAHKANEPIEAVGVQETDGFFREDKDLFGLTDSAGNQIRVINKMGGGLYPFYAKFYSEVDPDGGTIDMSLWFDNNAIFNALDAADGTVDGKAADGAGKLTQLSSISHDEKDRVYVFNKHDDENTATNQTPGKVVLGQISFRVKEDRLAEVIDLFDGLDVVNEYRYPAGTPKRPEVSVKTPDGTVTGKVKLLDINQDLTGEEDPWTIGYYGGTPSDRTTHYYTPGMDSNIAEHYIFNFNRRLIVSVELTNPDFEINAYQNFTAGNTGDLRISMGRWANMVTVTYSDGTKENKPFPWGQAGSGYSARYVRDLTQLDADSKPTMAWKDMTTAAITSYDPTADVANSGVGTDYIFSQSYQTYKTDADGAYLKNLDGTYQVEYTFPIPVVGHMRVTPITVIKVTAEDLTRTYPVSEVVDLVADVNALNLPSQARIITDIVPGNVSLVTPIKGWRSTQAASTWPTGNSSTAMNALKADSYVAPVPPATVGYPYWPDTADKADTNPTSPTYAPDHFVGDYSFETAASDGGAPQGILRTDIQASFPWLTVPQPSYPVDGAVRKIVKPEDYVDAKDYEVRYVSTVTKTTDSRGTNGDGQPTLTLSVGRSNGEDMAEPSVFRVWLPNALELGTGQNEGGIPVDNWFNDPEAGSDDHVNGFYDTNRRGESSGKQIFHLNTNPSDPATPVSTATANYHNDDRETLRRYINLGGWYHVAICEDPDDATPHWTDPIPVYVPPRRNEYQESKVYNFVGENQGLFHWPGNVGSVMAFPQGDYEPVAPDLSDTTGSYIGLPLYEVLDGDGVVERLTNAVLDAADIFENGNPNRLKSSVRRYSESYGVETTYDGQTGAQPGTIFTVKVDADDTTHTADWNSPTTNERTHPSVANAVGGTWPAQGDPVTKHGQTPLYDDYRVTGFGTVYQPEDDPDTYRATLRYQLEQEPPQLIEKITLTSTADDGITRQPPGTKADNVTLVTFNTVTEGYTVRQDHLLTINNVGDVDIYGLDIDSLVDGYNLNDNGDRTAPEGGHFEITMPPASFLPAGTSTNFILTYVYDLRANNVDSGLKYRDTLYITSTSHPNAKAGGTNQNDHPAGDDYDYLLDFDAELTVSASPLHQVTVIYRPTDGTMGTAGIIVGEQVSGGDVVMNDVATTRTYPKEEPVYIHVRKEDEYAVKSITAVIDGVTVDLLHNNAYGPDLTLPNNSDYRGTAEVTDGHEVYVFEMPNHDVTVYVDFYEPTTSKLRLDHIIDFSDPDTNDLVKGYDPTGVYEPTDPGHIYKVWKKQFTGKDAKGTAAATGDYAAAETWSAGHGNADKDFYLMTQGSAIPATQGGDDYNSSHKHYLVVIDAEDDFSQIKATLRNVKYHVDYQGTDTAHPNGYNDDIEPTVNMTLYYKDDVLENWTSTAASDAVYDAGHGYGPYDATGTTNLRPNGSTADNTQHLTDTFDSPAPGESAYVHIVISYPGDGVNEAGERHYYVEIHRRAAEPEVVLHYGNAPYGMIMNEKKFIAIPTAGTAAAIQAAQDQTDRTRAVVKSAFLTGYTFRGADRSVLPDAAKDKLQSVVYWREAWVRNLGLFEPESLTGFHAVLDGDGKQTFSDEAQTKPIYAPNKDVYDEADNLDLNDYAFFAILGQEMWEPGVISAKDSSGREVSLLDIHARAMDLNATDGVTLLDTTKTPQVDRFSGTDTAIIDLGVAGQKLTALAEHAATPVTVATDATLGVTQWPAKATTTTTTPAEGEEAETTTTYSVIEDIRPGRYIIQYSYYDFDGVSLLTATRPFVILREVGDVNVDGVRDAIDAPADGNSKSVNDEYAIEDRVTHDPLGYEAGGWDAANRVQTVYPYANIFKFRVCDANNDRNINNIDANQVAKNVKDKGGWLRFYDPVDYGHPGAPITAPSGS